MKGKDTQTLQKLRGGYYTPASIAKYLWDYVKTNHPNRLLEPAAGDGALLKPIQTSIKKIDAIEYQKSEAEKIKENTQNPNITVYADDFFNWFNKYHDNLYDAVLSNPPYIRYQYLTEEQRIIQSEVLTSNGMRSNRLINAWVAFVVASISMLRDGGRIGLVIPSDLLQVTYAKDLRQFMLRNFAELNLISFKKAVFPNTEQRFILLLGIKGRKTPKFRHVVVDDIDDLPNLDEYSYEPIPENYEKWSDLILPGNEREFLFKHKQDSIPFNNIASVEVGITTGSNPFFSLTQDKMQELNCRSLVRPLLGRSVSVDGLFYDQASLENNAKAGQKVWLLDLNNRNYDSFPDQLKNYITDAENNNINSAYKLRIRKIWYQIPSIWVPQAFLLRRIGKLPKLVINKVNAVSTDTFHRVRLIDNININLLLIAFYSSISLVYIELAGRSYGGGALEILPGDSSQFKLPAINYFQDIDLTDEIDKLDVLIKTNDVDEISSYCDNVLKKVVNFDFDSEKYQKILKYLHQFRFNEK
ncbi:MAG: N-6 DNA methylase [Enterococcus sp.]|nr:N-6 DNA methylase [Enterococcus sp.]